MSILYLLSVPLAFAFLSLVFTSKVLVRSFFLLGTMVLAVAGWWLVFQSNPKEKIFAFGENLMMDSFCALFILIIVSIGLLSSLYAAGYLFKEDESAIPLVKLKRYAFFFHLFLFTMLLTVCSNNLGIMWIAIEGTTLASAFLVNVDDKKSSIEAAWKYLILCTVGIALALFGIILVYYSAISGAIGDGKDFLHWTFLMEHARQLDPEVMKLAFIFILVGYGTKSGLAPFHSWLPDAHSQAPSPVSALLSGVLLSCAIFGIVRFHALTQIVTNSQFSGNLLIFFGLLSVAIATPFILIQGDYKRLFAYSSVEHMGLVAVGFGFGGLFGIYGALLHIINHAFTKSLLFFSSGHLLHHYRTKEIQKINGIIKTSPLLGGIFFLGVLAIAGLPPFSIFVSEFVILASGFIAKRFAVCAILLLLLILVFAGLLKHASSMVFGKSEQPVHSEKSLLMDGVLCIGVVLILVMGVYLPTPLNHLLQEASLVIQGKN
ncbi:MAG: hydrogenase 4 subunit F [Candidatus Omnitrophica bacterium]|nr:hydrogenase 4 subunit F [Candidatus Omnitrophota bacterium]